MDLYLLLIPAPATVSVGIRLDRHDVRVGRVTTRVERAHAIAVTRVDCEPTVGKTRDICADRAYLRKVGAILTRTALDGEALLVS